jgi:hypothetical protein
VVKGYSKPTITKCIIWDNTWLFEYFQSIDINHCLLQKEIAELDISKNAHNRLSDSNHFGLPANVQDFSAVLEEDPGTSIAVMFGNEEITVGVISE